MLHLLDRDPSARRSDHNSTAILALGAAAGALTGHEDQATEQQLRLMEGDHADAYGYHIRDLTR